MARNRYCTPITPARCHSIGYLFPNRLFNYIGASEVDPDSICNAAGHTAWTLLYGSSIQGFDPRTAARCPLHIGVGRQSLALRAACP
jgi:hypothetical protein